MTPKKNFKLLRDELAERVGEGRLAEDAEHVRASYDAYQARLAELRHARALTQVQLARSLGVSQAQISRIERQNDLYLSTLASYLEAMGARLELVAAFDDTGERVAIDVAPPDVKRA